MCDCESKRMLYGFYLKNRNYIKARNVLMNELCFKTRGDSIFRRIQEINLNWYENRANFVLSRNDQTFLESTALIGIPESGSAQTVLFATTGEWVQEIHQLPDLQPRQDEKNSISEEEIQLYPNPASREINIKIDLNEKENAVFTFSDIVGHVVKTGTLDNNSDTIDISDLGSGIYFINLRYNGNENTYKIVIQN